MPRPAVIEHLVCWLLHHREREVLIPGVLPYGFDAVVFCWRCDRFRGRGVQVFDPTRRPGFAI
jgi:hypothetical protein